MAEKVITCPVCFDNDHCFEEVQDEWSSYICFRCGYTSNSMYKTDSKELESATKGSTELMKEVSFYDVDRDITWFPSIVNMGDLGIIYPEGTIPRCIPHYKSLTTPISFSASKNSY